MFFGLQPDSEMEKMMLNTLCNRTSAALMAASRMAKIVTAVFWVALIASVLTLGFALMLPGRKKSAVKIAGR